MTRKFGIRHSSSAVSQKPPVVLLGGETIAVSAARSLHADGVRVYALGHAGYDPVCRSRSCDTFVHLGSGVGIQERWLEWLADGPRGAVILPCSDEGLELVARHRPTLTELGYRPVEANDEVMLAMLDKQRTYELARSVGVPVPRTTVIRGLPDIASVASDFEYPCALKPLHSHHFARHFGLRAKATVAADQDSLVRSAAEVLPLGLEMLVTEIIADGGDDYCSYYTYLDESGEPLFHFTKRKFRQFPPHFGVGTYHMTDWNPEVAEVGLRFLQGIGLRGLANVEFKRDARDGKLKLIECNHRLTAATDLVKQAGLDLASLAYDGALGRAKPLGSTYRKGLRLWCPVEDLRTFLLYRRRGELTFAAWTRSLLHRQHFPLFRFSDPMPTFFSLSRRIRRAVAKVRTSATAVNPESLSKVRSSK